MKKMFGKLARVTTLLAVALHSSNQLYIYQDNYLYIPTYLCIPKL